MCLEGKYETTKISERYIFGTVINRIKTKDAISVGYRLRITWIKTICFIFFLLKKFDIPQTQ